MPKRVIKFLFKEIRNGVPGYILEACPKNVRVESAKEWTAVHTLHMPKPVITLKVLWNGLPRYIYFTHA